MSALHLKTNPTLDDIQKYVQDMLEERGFAGQDVMQRFLLLTEEMGELAKCIRKSHAGMAIDANKEYELDAAGEIADILLVLTSVANQLGINMESAFREKEEKNKLRVWK
ncbi:MAG TPA: MazG nucleotide pyrophosphohydrolase domain-containing protein [Patescibacteria group bacterium]|nr:MazG nucleotide pyrophosphohydrolase domain-containing protein [Patescibacteria group bacterium]